jgi:hypothetical protein
MDYFVCETKQRTALNVCAVRKAGISIEARRSKGCLVTAALASLAIICDLRDQSQPSQLRRNRPRNDGVALWHVVTVPERDKPTTVTAAK